MPVLVEVVTDQFALRVRCSRLKEGFSHTESLGSQEGGRKSSGLDVQLSRNDELRGSHPDPAHRQKRCCPVLRGQVLMIQLCSRTVEFPLVQKIQGFGRVTRATAVSRLQVPNTRTAQKSSKVLTEFKLVLQETTRSMLMLPLSS